MTVPRTRALRREATWDGSLYRGHPLFWPVAPFAARFEAFTSFPTAAELTSALAPFSHIEFRTQLVNQRRGRQRHVEPPYEDAIASGSVPTRAGSWHDFWNALVWAAFPSSKRLIHALQRELVAAARARGEPGKRLPLHDMLALLDEGGVVVLSPGERPVEHDAALTLDPERDRALVFGHAVFESIAIQGPFPLVRAIWLPAPSELDRADGAAIVRAVDALLTATLASPERPSNPKGLSRVALDAVAACGPTGKPEPTR
ncbi:MAG: DUF3025 domain-containing protein [Polyangiaceae bacterium]